MTCLYTINSLTLLFTRSLTYLIASLAVFSLASLLVYFAKVNLCFKSFAGRGAGSNLFRKRFVGQSVLRGHNGRRNSRWSTKRKRWPRKSWGELEKERYVKEGREETRELMVPLRFLDAGEFGDGTVGVILEVLLASNFVYSDGG